MKRVGKKMLTFPLEGLEDPLSVFNSCLLFSTKNAITTTCKNTAMPAKLNPIFFPKLSFVCLGGGFNFRLDDWWIWSLFCRPDSSSGAILGGIGAYFLGGGGGGDRRGGGGGGGGGETSGDCGGGFTSFWDCTAIAKKLNVKIIKVNNGEAI